MNMRSSTGRQEKANNANQSPNDLGTTVRSSLRVQKRWQPKARRVGAAIAPRAAASISQTDLETALRQEALQAAQRGDHNEAIALFSIILEQNPDSARDYNNRGLVYFQSGDMERAIADYNRALELDSTLDSVYNNRANYYAAQGKFLEAILDYDAALDLNPTNVRAWFNQGITLRELEMHDRALECFDFALRLGRLEAHIYAERAAPTTSGVTGMLHWPTISGRSSGCCCPALPRLGELLACAFRSRYGKMSCWHRWNGSSKSHA
jgi:tetratricopeptide (TPR) repeat protein